MVVVRRVGEVTLHLLQVNSSVTCRHRTFFFLFSRLLKKRTECEVFSPSTVIVVISSSFIFVSSTPDTNDAVTAAPPPQCTLAPAHWMLGIVTAVRAALNIAASEC